MTKENDKKSVTSVHNIYKGYLNFNIISVEYLLNILISKIKRTIKAV